MNNKKSNEYALLNFNRDSEPVDVLRFQPVVFYELNKDGSFDNGTTLEEMLRVSIERLSDLNGRYACKENEEALSHLKDALNYLNIRTANRKSRGVEGKHQL